MRFFIVLLFGLSWLGVSVNAQEYHIFKEFRDEAGDHSQLYVGKVESGYPSTKYSNHPYWTGDEFVSGENLYNGLLYKDVHLRFDAYLQQLVVRTPEKRANVCVVMDSVEKFSIGNIEFVRRNDKFQALLYQSSRMELVELVRVSQNEEIIDKALAQYKFKRDVKYNVLRGGQVYEVRKLKTVLNLFPELKKELKRFAKTRHLNFKEHRQSALIAVLKYADDLVAQS